MPMLLRVLDAIFILVIAVALIWFGSSAFGTSCPSAVPGKPPLDQLIDPAAAVCRERGARPQDDPDCAAAYDRELQALTDAFKHEGPAK